MTDTKAIIDQFIAAFLQRAPDKLVDLIADDCVMVPRSADPRRAHAW